MSFSAVRVDNVDGFHWFETPETETASVKLHRLFDIGPRSWAPLTVLSGPNGAGKTTLAKRVIGQLKRAVACDLVEQARARRDAPLPLPSTEILRRAAEQADRFAREQADSRRRVRDFGSCPRICSPASFVPEENLDEAIHAAMHGTGRRESFQDAQFRRAAEDADKVVPAQVIPLQGGETARHVGDLIGHALFNTPGDRSNDPLRRTRLLFLDRADRLLTLRDKERTEILAAIEDYPRPVTVVLIGTARLAEAVRTEGVTQVIELPPMSVSVFSEVVRLVFGQCAPDEVRQLYEASGGVVGPLLHIAALRGLEPPYCVPQAEIRRLPTPA